MYYTVIYYQSRATGYGFTTRKSIPETEPEGKPLENPVKSIETDVAAINCAISIVRLGSENGSGSVFKMTLGSEPKTNLTQGYCYKTNT